MCNPRNLSVTSQCIISNKELIFDPDRLMDSKLGVIYPWVVPYDNENFGSLPKG